MSDRPPMTPQDLGQEPGIPTPPSVSGARIRCLEEQAVFCSDAGDRIPNSNQLKLKRDNWLLSLRSPGLVFRFTWDPRSPPFLGCLPANQFIDWHAHCYSKTGSCPLSCAQQPPKEAIVQCNMHFIINLLSARKHSDPGEKAMDKTGKTPWLTSTDALFAKVLINVPRGYVFLSWLGSPHHP